MMHMMMLVSLGVLGDPVQAVRFCFFCGRANFRFILLVAGKETTTSYADFKEADEEGCRAMVYKVIKLGPMSEYLAVKKINVSG